MTQSIENSDTWLKKNNGVLYKCVINLFNDRDDSYDISYYGLNKHNGRMFVKNDNVSESQIVRHNEIKFENGDYITIENPEKGEESIYINGTEFFTILSTK